MLMSKKNTEIALQEFIEHVVNGSKDNLEALGKVASGDLLKSINGNLKASDNSIEVNILGADYLKFIDKGVHGVGGLRKTFKGKKLDSPIQWQLKKVTNSSYRFKNKRPPANLMRTWAKRKRGVFRKRGDKGMGFAIAESVYRTGIETTNFFTIPFEKAFERLPKELVESYALDIESFMEFTLKD
jgi:hypothetical protein